MLALTAKHSVTTTAIKAANPPRMEPTKNMYAETKATTAVTKGRSKILRKHTKTMLDMSRLESGRGLKISTALEEINEVETCRPMNTMRNKTDMRKAVTEPMIAGVCVAAFAPAVNDG
jgi:hypothetical protein